MWNGRTIAVVLPTFRERNSIAAVVKGFEALGIVDEIVVVNNNAEAGTSAEVNPDDLLKLLPYSVDCDAVFGSRTVSTFIWSGANMNWFLRWGNWAVAKLIEILYNTPYLSDVGCTYRVISRECIQRIAPEFRSNGSRFGLEMQLLVVATSDRFVQVPVNYHPRVGESAVTGDVRKAFALGIDMIGLVLRIRLRRERLRAARA